MGVKEYHKLIPYDKRHTRDLLRRAERLLSLNGKRLQRGRESRGAFIGALEHAQ